MSDQAGSPEEQLKAAQGGVLLLMPPLVDLEPLRVRGKDRVQWLNGMVTSDVAKLAVGAAQYGLHVGKTGKVVAELWIVNGEDELVVGVPRGRAAELASALDRYLIMEQCEIVAGEPDARFALALGPDASKVVEVARKSGLGGGVARRGGLACGLVWGEAAQLEGLVAGSIEPMGSASVKATPEGWHRVRVELGIGKAGVDFDETAYPQEAALEMDGVSFSKGCYLGQEAVFMMQERGHPPRRMVQLEIADGPHGALGVAVGAAVTTADGVEVGKVTSSMARGAAGATLALATVKWKHAKGETALVVGGCGAKVSALAAK